MHQQKTKNLGPLVSRRHSSPSCLKASSRRSKLSTSKDLSLPSSATRAGEDGNRRVLKTHQEMLARVQRLRKRPRSQNAARRAKTAGDAVDVVAEAEGVGGVAVLVKGQTTGRFCQMYDLFPYTLKVWWI